jgi:hypothetical protein
MLCTPLDRNEAQIKKVLIDMDKGQPSEGLVGIVQVPRSQEV